MNGPLDLDLTYRCGQSFRWIPKGEGWSGVVGRAEAHVSWNRVPDRGRLPGGVVTIQVTGEDPGAPAWTAYHRLDEHPERHLSEAEALFALPGFPPLLGLRLLRQEPWETLASFICSAAANLRKITACVEGMAGRFGEEIPGSTRRTFPRPEALARARESDLRALGLGFRAPLLLQTARQLRREPMDWEALRKEPLAEARTRLGSLPGVGPKIADCVLLFGLDRLDAYPVDRWIRRATLELWGRRKATDRELDAWAHRLGPGRGYVQQLLFHLRRTGGPFPSLEPATRRRRRSA